MKSPTSTAPVRSLSQSAMSNNNSTFSKHTISTFSLLLSTMMDCPDLIKPSEIPENNEFESFSVLEIYEIIQLYQKQNNRAYSLQIIFYIIACMLDNKLVDLERAAKISGTRFYFLKNELVELEFALILHIL